MEQDSESNSNVPKLVGMLEIAMTEIICSKASMQLRKITPEKQLAKLKIITQIPNFRIGLIVKIIQLMHSEMEGLKKHVANYKQN